MNEPGKEKIEGWPLGQVRHLLDDSLLDNFDSGNKTAPVIGDFSKTMNGR